MNGVPTWTHRGTIPSWNDTAGASKSAAKQLSAGNETYACHNFSPHFRRWCAANFHNAFSTKFYTPWWWLACWKKMIFVSTVAFRFPSCLRCKLQNLICWYLRWWARAKHSKCVFLKESKKSSVFTFLVAWSGKYGYPQITVCCWSRYLKTKKSLKYVV